MMFAMFIFMVFFMVSFFWPSASDDGNLNTTNILDISEFDFTSAFGGSETTNNNFLGLRDIIFQNPPEFRNLLENSGNREFLTTEHIERLRDPNYLINTFYSRDLNAGLVLGRFNIDNFLNTDLRLEKDDSSAPQVLIFHTHAGTEFFVDSDPTNIYTGVVGAGVWLQYYLENKHGIITMHHTGVYDVIDGVSARGGSYERMEVSIQRILEENPSIQVVIDLHRDGIDPNPHLVTYIDGRPHARLMFVNGVSALAENGIVRELPSLPNPNLDANLALSFNMQIAANEFFPGLMRRLYLKAFRFSTHMKPHSLLVEVGSQHNTMEEAFNTMELLADLINEVIFN